MVVQRRFALWKKRANGRRLCPAGRLSFTELGVTRRGRTAYRDVGVRVSDGQPGRMNNTRNRATGIVGNELIYR